MTIRLHLKYFGIGLFADRRNVNIEKIERTMDLEKQLLTEWTKSFQQATTTSKAVVFQGSQYARQRSILCFFYRPIRQLLIDINAILQLQKNKPGIHSDKLLMRLSFLYEKWRIIVQIDENGDMTFGYDIERNIQNANHEKSVQEYDLELFHDEVLRGIDIEMDFERYRGTYALLSIKLDDDDKIIISDLIHTLTKLRNERSIKPSKPDRQKKLEKGNAKGYLKYQSKDIQILTMASQGKSNEEIVSEIAGETTSTSSSDISKRLWAILDDLNSHNNDWPKEKNIIMKSRLKKR